MAATGDFKDGFFHNFWANPAVARGNFCEAGNGVEACNGVSKADEFREAFGCFGAERIKEGAFAGNGARLGGENFVLKRLQLRRDVALGVAQRLATRELCGRLGRVGMRNLNVVAKHTVVANFQAWNAVSLAEFCLIARHPCGGVALQ